MLNLLLKVHFSLIVFQKISLYVKNSGVWWKHYSRCTFWAMWNFQKCPIFEFRKNFVKSANLVRICSPFLSIWSEKIRRAFFENYKVSIELRNVNVPNLHYNWHLHFLNHLFWTQYWNKITWITMTKRFSFEFLFIVRPILITRFSR